MVTFRRIARAARAAVGTARAVASLATPPPRDGELVVHGAGGRTVEPGKPFRILCWNVQYCAGRQRRFFYDGGPDVRVDADEVEATLTGITTRIRHWSPDVVVLQEVDRGARRTAGIDQHAAIGRALGLACGVSAPYHRVGWVPFPPEEHLGRVDMHLSVFSAFQALRAGTQTLPLLEESWLRRRFNLRRALVDVDLATAAGPPLRLFDTHLSAFSFGDGSLGRQIARCAAAAGEVEAAHGRWILAGDFNALPPGDRSERLGADAALYPEKEPPIRALTDRFGVAGPSAPTWVPWGSNQPDRQLDWLFHGRAIAVRDHRADAEGARWSDHLPLVTDLVVLPR